MKRVSGWYLFVLNAYWIGLSFMWNSLHVTILPVVLLNYVPEAQKNTWLGEVKFIGLILAMLIQPIAGAISDRWQAKMGRRRPFIWLGTVSDLFFLLIMGFLGGLPALFIGYIGLQITSNVAHGPAQGLLPDEVPVSQLGMASGIKTTMDMVAIILSSLLMGKLISIANPDPKSSILVIIGFLIVFGGITLVFSREKSTFTEKRDRINLKSLVKSVFYFKAKGNRNYWRLILSRFLFLVGIYGFQNFILYLIIDKFPANTAANSTGGFFNSLLNSDPVMFTQVIMGIFVVVLIIFTLLSGHWSDSIGRKRLQILSSLIGAAGAVLLIFATNRTQLIIFSIIPGAGVGIFLATNWALANQMAPVGDVGKFIGLTNLATAGSAAVASSIEGPMIDVLNHIAPGQWWGWTALFGISGLLMVLSILPMFKVPEYVTPKEISSTPSS